MGRCSTLKEAELIPDSAVPYTLPESRCNSSNRQTSKFESRRALAHLTTCARRWALKKRPERRGSVTEGQPQLVSQREEPAARVCVCVCMWSVWSLQRGEKKRASGNGCSERSQQIGC